MTNSTGSSKHLFRAPKLRFLAKKLRAFLRISWQPMKL